MWDRDGRHIWATRSEAGGVIINGQDLNAGPRGVAEYEYALTISSDDIPKVLAALGGATQDNVLELLRDHGETIVRIGERKWLTDLGVKWKPWSWFDPDDFETWPASI